ncbi:GNAT family N-acetyltransferase [Periweissella ghanensis]|uniref:Peptidyl-lysine N-acetyltransferase YjaB n=1 Tax=Periweissella ghanensis TaxID=467997 RepID=A0ABN8BMN8_9LACO|nr:GNAT family N-acetyltransferase [Periweissella ghanensis]MCM0601201.1 GNAT family N-acetyltransferase [Periweissella ghanensis]CAH0418001.1 Peptidyl-lysine N-acetyltransferase YjaB [Periweissella ghanensis]
MLQQHRVIPTEYPLILAIWEQSVAATHTFLHPADFAFYQALLPNFLAQVDLRLWLVDNQPIGFSGTSGDELAMLFLDPTKIGAGYGHQILTWLITNQHITKVDVNEQNDRAHAFYLNHGFQIVGRSQRDDFDKPYPILHLAIREQQV